MTDVAKLSLDNGEVLELPVVVGTEGERAVDISKLRADTGYITLDDGYVNTGSTASAITFLDGEQGILRYRGYPVEQLGEHCDFIEVSYLLIYGELPTADQLQEFRSKLRRHTMLHEDMRLFYDGFPRDAHPMAILSSVCGALSTFYQDSLSSKDPEQVDRSILRLMAKLPTIAAYAHKKSIGQPFVYPRNDLTYCENFLRMMFAVPTEPFEADPDFVEALNLLLIVHADHEQNCSTSTVRMVGSSDANLFASIAAGICALWGPLHGGANEACVAMLQGIVNDGGDVKKYVEKVKEKNSGVRLMGFGHRVYKNFDPRATIIKRACDKLLAKRHITDPIFEVAKKLEEVGAPGRILHRAKAVSERRFLFRRDLSRDWHPGADVHRAVCDGPAAGLDRQLARNAAQPDEKNLPPAADLHRTGAPRVRAGQRTRLSCCDRQGDKETRRQGESVDERVSLSPPLLVSLSSPRRDCSLRRREPPYGARQSVAVVRAGGGLARAGGAAGGRSGAGGTDRLRRRGWPGASAAPAERAGCARCGTAPRAAGRIDGGVGRARRASRRGVCLRL